MADFTFPGGFNELEFLRTYQSSTLRFPQVVSDSVLRASVLAGQVDRVLLTGLLAQQTALACLRLTHVFKALDDRAVSVARTLSGPLPAVETWAEVAQTVMSFPPSAIAARLSLGEAAVPYAEQLRGIGDFGFLTAITGPGASLNPMVMVPANETHRAPTEVILAGPPDDRTAARLGAGEGDAALLADLTAELCSVARGLLGVYIEARAGARHA